MIASATGVATHPLVVFLREHFVQLSPLFRQAKRSDAAFVSALNEQLHMVLHHSSDARLLPFLLAGCQVLPTLGQKQLAHFLSRQSLPPAHFLSEPPAHFESVLVPVGEDAKGSGFVWYFAEGMAPDKLFFCLAHVYGHLVLGHLRKGDRYSHYDTLADLQAPSGPARRWDRVVQAMLPLWFQPLPDPMAETEVHPVEWHLPGFAAAFDRFQRGQVDEPTLAVQVAAARYSEHLPEVDVSLQEKAQLFPHQLHGAVELAVRLQKLGVVLLADAVGLGKTRTTAAAITILRKQGIIKKAAIFTPGKLARNWKDELALLDLTVGTPGDADADVILINKDKFKRLEAWEVRQQVRGCDLLIVEEAHQDLRHSGNKFHRNLREAAVEGGGKYGLLVTATPWNNRRGDIFAMLQPFAAATRGSDVPAQVFRCFSTLKAGQKEFEQNDQLFRQVYHLTTLQRTRRQLRESGEHSVFYAPRRPYLVSVPYSPEQRDAFATLLDQIEQLRLPHFHPIRYLTSADSGENRLSGIHRFVLLKRAESSMYAFERSLRHLSEHSRAMFEELDALADGDAAIAAWLRRRYALEEAADEMAHETSADVLVAPRMRSGRIRGLIAQAEQTGQLRALRARLIDDCQHDIEILQRLQQDFHGLFVTDPKMGTVVAQIDKALAAGQKVLCISQFADTAQVLYRILLKNLLLVQKGIGLVVSSTNDPSGPTQINGRPATREEVLSRFAPRSWAGVEGGKQKLVRQPQSGQSELALLVGSDTLSVGQNLQDARVLLNLDLCWNPMLHEQRIGRIDRPRHSDDSAPLDIYYFLNLDVIEAELRLRETIEKRLAATYQDTAFDDEILPGYFEMIEHFRKLRWEQSPDALYVDEANELLESLAERSARPPEVSLPSNAEEQAALLRLQEAARIQANNGPRSSSRELLITLGRVPLYDQHLFLRPNPPHRALLAEIAFQPVDHEGHAIDRAIFRPYYLARYTTAETPVDQPTITLESGTLLHFVDGLLAEPVSANFALQPKQLAQLQDLLHHLEEQVQHEQSLHQAALMRARRYRSRLHAADEADLEEGVAPVVGHEHAERIEVRLVSARFLV
jgi:hypothetical protein